jgi:hypothetical protein
MFSKGSAWNLGVGVDIEIAEINGQHNEAF